MEHVDGVLVVDEPLEISNHIYENIMFNYFVLEQDNHIYNNYIYHILHNNDILTFDFFINNLYKVSLLSYSNYFVDTNNVTDSYNFNLEYSKDNFMDYIKLNTDYKEHEYNIVLMNLINKYTNTKLTEPWNGDLLSNFPHYYKEAESIHDYFKNRKIKGFEVVNTTIKYNGNDVQVENLYDYKFFKITKLDETIFLLKDTEFKGKIISGEDFLNSVYINISDLKLKKK